MGPFVFRHNYAISCDGACDGGESPFRGKWFLKNDNFWDKNLKKIDFFDFPIFELVHFSPCHGGLAIFGPKINSFQEVLKTTRPEPNRTDPPEPLDFPRKNQQFCYRIATQPTRSDPIRTDPPDPRPDPTRPDERFKRRTQKAPLSPVLVGAVILLRFPGKMDQASSKLDFFS